jgi:6-phosphogluconolactonase (cycloisomerase 2 family)
MAGGRTPADGKRLGEQMSKKISGLFALLAFLGLSLFLINCGSSSSRPAGVLYVLSQGENNVGSFAIDLGSGRLSLINKTAPADTTPSIILLDPSGNVAYVLNTGSNSITSYTTNSDGSLSAPTSISLPVQNSLAMARDAAGTFLFVVSQGAIPLPADGSPCPHPEPNTECPALTVFAIQSGSATLTPVGDPIALSQVPTSVAATTVTTTQLTKTLLYITNDVDLVPLQDDNTVAAYQVDATSGQVTPQTNPPYATGSVPTAVLAVQTTPTGGSGGLFVYVANSGSGSGANSVSIFQVCTQLNATCTAPDVTATNNTLIPVGNPVSVGLNPVAMTVDPTNNFLYVVNHGSSTLSAFRINPTTGELSALNPSSVSTGSSPVAITMHSSGKFLYVSNNASSNISGFDVSTTNGALSNATNVTSSAQPAGLVAK